jgi:HAD superfamily hydrolase (TIGR01509 family)
VAKLTDARTHGALLPPVKEPWIVFDLIGVLAEPSWREISSAPDLDKWKSFRIGMCSELDFWSEDCARAYRALLGFRPDRLAYLVQLKERGLRICLATNFSSAWWDTLKLKLPQPGLVDKLLISDQLKVAKPDPRFFAVMKKIVPAGSVMVDDSAPNCIAAEAAGYRSIWTYPGIALEAVVDSIIGVPDSPPQRRAAGRISLSGPRPGSYARIKRAQDSIPEEHHGSQR